jgi:rhodanese-related sulfurtransferase
MFLRCGVTRPICCGEIEAKNRMREYAMREISRAELKERMDRRGNLKLVFTLGEWQYNTAHIPGSLNLPCSLRLYQSEDAFKDLEADDEIVVYCSNKSCFSSISVYYLLEKRGYKNVRRYAGGLLDWEEANYPLEGEMSITN